MLISRDEGKIALPAAVGQRCDLPDLTLGEGDLGALDLEVLAQVEHWFINAVVYSNNDYDMVFRIGLGQGPDRA